MTMSANIEPPDATCARGCAQTWRHFHEATSGGPGDVRRCKHGRYWLWNSETDDYKFDIWDRLSWLWTPILYHRAKTAIQRAEQNT